MAVPFDPTDPTLLSPEQRLDELSALLAAGVMRELALHPPSLLQIQLESGPDRLDLSGQQSVHARGVNSKRELQKETR
jgi:hypothetical protein